MYPNLSQLKRSSFVRDAWIQADHPARKFYYDSRKVHPNEEGVFLCLSGGGRSGADFIEEVYAAGVRSFVISEADLEARNDALKAFFEAHDQVNVLVTSHVLEAFQNWAAAYRKGFNIPVIGITGSNGKTSVKEWLVHLLGKKYYLVYSPNSFNSQLGLPLSIWETRPEHQMAIFEAGISVSGEMARLEAILKPDLGVLTGIGPAHDEGFPDRKTKWKEKLSLFKDSKALAAPAEFCPEEMRLLVALRKDQERFLWERKGSTAATDPTRPTLTQLEEVEGGSRLLVAYRNRSYELTIPFREKSAVDNAMTCFSALCALELDPAHFEQEFSSLPALHNRLEFLKGIGDTVILNDGWNADLRSLEVGLQALEWRGKDRKKTLILSDLLETGELPDELYQKAFDLARSHKVDQLIGVGPELHGRAPGYSKDSMAFTDTQSLLEQLDLSGLHGKAILIKGARRFALDRLARKMDLKNHGTVLHISLAALEHNLNVFRSELKPGVRILAMVKAFGYGAGAEEVARLFQQNGVDYLGVAYVQEGIQLRQAGIHLPIMVMNPEPLAMERLIEYKLEPELYAPDQALDFLEMAQRYGIKNYPVHIKLETGMNRLGLDLAELEPIFKRLKKYRDPIQVKSVFTHLAAAEDPEQDDFSRTQIQKLEQLARHCRTELGYMPWKHVLNSAGSLRFPQAQFDMVRLGIGLYGFDPSGKVSQRLVGAARLTSRISRIRTLSKGESVSYGRNFKAQGPTRIATLPIGYADGLSRALSHGKWEVVVRGQRAPIAGTICMDMCMIDVTRIICHVGDEVDIFGPLNPVPEMAEKLNTVPYEILTSVSNRVKRIYHNEL